MWRFEVEWAGKLSIGRMEFQLEARRSQEDRGNQKLGATLVSDSH